MRILNTLLNFLLYECSCFGQVGSSIIKGPSENSMAILIPVDDYKKILKREQSMTHSIVEAP